MRILSFEDRESGTCHVGLRRGADIVRIDTAGAGLPADLGLIVEHGEDAVRGLDALGNRGTLVDPATVRFLPPVRHPRKIICIGLNYADHVEESPFEKPTYPTVFHRYASSLVAHEQPIVRPLCSEQLDYEGEMVAVIGKRGRHIPKARALEWVAGYSVFNEASIRDYQFKSTQWSVGKNFDNTGAFGPELVTSDELPPGAGGLRIETRLNGRTVQSSNTSRLLFDVAAVISILSEAMTFEPGDVIATGTPDGVGLFRKPPLFMKHGDQVEVEIEGIGVLRNPIVDEDPRAARGGDQ